MSQPLLALRPSSPTPPSPRPAPRLVPRIVTPVQPLPVRVGNGLRWSPEELCVLRERYPTGGAVACLPFLPARDSRAIYLKAKRLGMRFNAGYQRQAPSDERIDRLIRAAYANGALKPGAMRDLCAQTQRPRQWLRSRAIALGAIQHIRGPNWTKAEDALLERLEGKAPRTQQKALIAAGFTGRSESAITERLRRLGMMSTVDRSEIYSLNEVSKLLGVGEHRLIARWIQRGDLKAKAHGTETAGVTRWEILRADLREFLITHPLEWLPARCDRHWLIEILAGRVGPRVHD